jgi:class 3 adenylate cyclase
MPLMLSWSPTGRLMAEIRKLAAILAADIVGLSKLASAYEDRTLARIRSLRSDLIDPTIAVHNGRVVKRTGDGAIVEFRSAVDAVRCAVGTQNAMMERNSGAGLSWEIDQKNTANWNVYLPVSVKNTSMGSQFNIQYIHQF